MKILHFIPVYAPAWSYGGPVRSVSMLAEEQVRQGHDVTVFTTNAGIPAGDLTDKGDCVLRNGVKVHYFLREAGWGIKSRELESAARKRIKEFDLTHLSAIWHPVAKAAHAAARQYRVPVVISPRGALGSYAWSRRRLLKAVYYALFERRYFKAAAGFHFTSQKEELESRRYCFGRPCSIIANGIDDRIWIRNKPGGAHWRTMQGIGVDEQIILYVGRLHHKKGLEIMPEAVALLRKKFPSRKPRLVLVGPDEDGTLGRLRDLATRYGVRSSLHWVPILTDKQLPAAYSAADIFVMPSRHENFGNSAIEALACGCPALVSLETGCLEFGRECGMKPIEKHCPAEWADAIATAFENAREPFEEAMRDKLLARVGLHATAAEMLRFYQTILAG